MPRKTQASRSRPRRRSYSSNYYCSSSSSSSYSSESATDTPIVRHTILRHVAALPAFSTLYVTVHSTQNVHFKSQRAYCKMFVANTPMVENTTLNAMFNYFSSSQLQSFKTCTAQVENSNSMWNSKFEICVNDPNVDVLSILVKSQQNLLYRPIIGVCVLNLKNLIDSPDIDQWFPLRKGFIQTGHIRLQLQLKKMEFPTLSPLAQDPSSLPNDARAFEKNHQSENK